MTASDDDARRRVRHELGTSLVVNGGPGTGRTQVLVERAAALVRGGHHAAGEVVLVTADDLGAADVRARLETSLSSTATGRRCDNPTVITVFDMARRILDEHGLQWGIAPGFAVLDAAEEQVDFEDRWDCFVDTLFEDDTARLALVHAFSLGLSPDGLLVVASGLYLGRDCLPEDAPVGPARDTSGARGPSVPAVDTGPVLRALHAAASMRVWCNDPEDLLHQHLRHLAVMHDELAALKGDDQAVLQFLDNRRPFTCALGQQARWSGHAEEVRAACEEAEKSRRRVLGAVGGAALTALLARLLRFVQRIMVPPSRTDGRVYSSMRSTTTSRPSWRHACSRQWRNRAPRGPGREVCGHGRRRLTCRRDRSTRCI
jgi:hypothetical protein